MAGLFPNDILNACYPDQPGVAPKYCDLVQRDPTTQSISRIVNLYANVARLSTDGIDLAVRYALPTTIGRFAAAFDGTWLHKIDQTNPDGTITHGRGTFDLSAAEYGGANPPFKFNAGIGWALDRLGAAMNMRFVGAIHECADQGFFVTLNGRCSADATYRRLVPNYASFDVQLRYELRTGAGKTIFTVGANNVFDRTPPVIYSGFTAATDPATYDFMGRFVYGRIAHSF